MSTAKDNRFYREAATSIERRVQIDYTNHAGVRQLRTIVPEGAGIWFGTSQWHPEPQWLLNAYDVGKDDMRTFAVKDIHGWQPDDSRAARADVSLAKLAQSAVERNGRMHRRLTALATVLEDYPEDHGYALDQREKCRKAIEAIMRDEDPV